MPPGLIVAGIVLAGIAIVVVALVVTSHIEKQRREQLQGLARELGFEYFTALPGSLDGWRSRFQLFATGHKRETSNVLQRQVDDLQVVLFDYAYTTGSGKHQHRHRQSVALFQSAELQLPRFRLTPEGWINRLGELFGARDIDFAEDPEFSRAFRLTGADEQAIRDRFGPDQRAVLLSHRNLSVEACEECVIVWIQDRRSRPEELRAFFEQAFGVYSALRASA